jgi:hypothetical protein
VTIYGHASCNQVGMTGGAIEQPTYRDHLWSGVLQPEDPIRPGAVSYSRPTEAEGTGCGATV